MAQSKWTDGALVPLKPIPSKFLYYVFYVFANILGSGESWDLA